LFNTCFATLRARQGMSLFGAVPAAAPASAAVVAFEALDKEASTVKEMRQFVADHELGVQGRMRKSELYNAIEEAVMNPDGNDENFTYAHRLPDTGAPRDLEDPRCIGLRAECEVWLHQLQAASVTEDEAKRNILAGAQRYGFVSGKWLLDVPESQAERAWELVATATREERLGCSAKFANTAKGGKRVILVYADDFGDRDACARLLGVGPNGTVAPGPVTLVEQESAHSLAGMGLLDCGCASGCGVRRDGFKPDIYTFLDQDVVGRWRIHRDMLPAAPWQTAPRSMAAGGASMGPTALPK
jgi:hypothetical protein